MNGPQDLGGAMGFGAVRPEPEDIRFHAPWERRALGVTLAAGALGAFSIDDSRATREALPWATYFGAGYYGVWIRALERLLVARGLVDPAELAGDPDAAPAAPPHPRRLTAERVAATLAAGSAYDRPVATPPRFAVGDSVRARNMHPSGHTRLPGYIRGHVGTITAQRGGFVLPDSNATGGGEAPQHLYTVRFEAATLWGPDAGPGAGAVHVDAWESYLDPA